MDLGLAVAVATVAAVGVPLVLARVFHGADRVDGRGRRVSRAWRGGRRRTS